MVVATIRGGGVGFGGLLGGFEVDWWGSGEGFGGVLERVMMCQVVVVFGVVLGCWRVFRG